MEAGLQSSVYSWRPEYDHIRQFRTLHCSVNTFARKNQVHNTSSLLSDLDPFDIDLMDCILPNSWSCVIPKGNL